MNQKDNSSPRILDCPPNIGQISPMKPILLLFLLITVVSCDSAKEAVITANGLQLFESEGIPGATEPIVDNDVEPLIHIHDEKAIFGDVRVGAVTGLTMMSTFQNAPIECAAYDITSSSMIPVWQADASQPSWQHGDGFGSVIIKKGEPKISSVVGFYSGAGNFTITLTGYNNKGESFWTQHYEQAQTDFGSLHPLSASLDGSIVAFGYYKNVSLLAPGVATIDIFDMQTGEVLCTMEADNPQAFQFLPVNLHVSDDDNFVMFQVGQYITVVDVKTCKARPLVRVRFTDTYPVISMSNDAQYLAYGFESVTVVKWNGQAYADVWNDKVAGFVTNLAISSKGDIGVCFTSMDFLNCTTEMRHIDDKTVVWSHETIATGNCQCLASNGVWNPDGSHFAVSNWGDCGAHTTPQVLVFDKTSSTPILSYITPGSMWWIDVDEDKDNLYVTAGGKAVHANTMGCGGDGFMFTMKK